MRVVFGACNEQRRAPALRRFLGVRSASDERALHDKRRQAKKEARKERAPAPTMSASNTLSTTGPFVDAYVYERSLQQKKQRKPPTEFVQFLFDRGLVHFFDPN